ncbi:MAG TPA: hypothetical protein VHE81_21935 [Lacipirellulaceae bacterium]|nr:hypothetical protein [Lacipirellulaceae bacterium]
MSHANHHQGTPARACGAGRYRRQYRSAGTDPYFGVISLLAALPVAASLAAIYRMLTDVLWLFSQVPRSVIS